MEWVNNLGTAGQVLLVLCAAICSIGGAVSVLSKVFIPHRSIKERVKRHDDLLGKDKEALDQIEANMNEERKTNRMICRSVLALLEHAITGNSVEKLKDAKTALQQHLIDN